MTAGTTFGTAILLAFWAVLLAELVGDKSLYALTSLALRFPWPVVYAAFAFASGAKMMVAAMLGSAVMRFPGRYTYLISAAAFFVSAILIWVDEPQKTDQEHARRGSWASGIPICFSSFFFTEWGDPGQIATAGLMLKSHLPFAIWIGSTLALMVKGAAALTLGLQIRNRLPRRTLRILASASCCVLGLLASGQGIMA